jgi:hypothetical protein
VQEYIDVCTKTVLKSFKPAAVMAASWAHADTKFIRLR